MSSAEKERRWTLVEAIQLPLDRPEGGYLTEPRHFLGPELEQGERVEVAEVSALRKVEAEREELLRQIQADHKAMAAIGGRSCCCKWCEQESPHA